MLLTLDIPYFFLPLRLARRLSNWLMFLWLDITLFMLTDLCCWVAELSYCTYLYIITFKPKGALQRSPPNSNPISSRVCSYAPYANASKACQPAGHSREQTMNF